MSIVSTGKSKLFTKAGHFPFAPVVTGSVFMRRSRLFLAKCYCAVQYLLVYSTVLYVTASSLICYIVTNLMGFLTTVLIVLHFCQHFKVAQSLQSHFPPRESMPRLVMFPRRERGALNPTVCFVTCTNVASPSLYYSNQ